jgi:hypothetical protein
MHQTEGRSNEVQRAKARRRKNARRDKTRRRTTNNAGCPRGEESSLEAVPVARTEVVGRAAPPVEFKFGEDAIAAPALPLPPLERRTTHGDSCTRTA